MYLKTRTLSISVISPNSESSYKLCSDAPIKVKTNLFFNFFFSAPIRIIYSSTLLFKIRVLINRHVKVITLLRAQTNHPRPLLKSSNSSSWRDPVIWGLSTSLAVLVFDFESQWPLNITHHLRTETDLGFKKTKVSLSNRRFILMLVFQLLIFIYVLHRFFKPLKL